MVFASTTVSGSAAPPTCQLVNLKDVYDKNTKLQPAKIPKNHPIFETLVDDKPFILASPYVISGHTRLNKGQGVETEFFFTVNGKITMATFNFSEATITLVEVPSSEYIVFKMTLKDFRADLKVEYVHFPRRRYKVGKIEHSHEVFQVEYTGVDVLISINVQYLRQCKNSNLCTVYDKQNVLAEAWADNPVKTMNTFVGQVGNMRLAGLVVKVPKIATTKAFGHAKDARHKSGIAFLLEKLKDDETIPYYMDIFIQRELEGSINREMAQTDTDRDVGSCTLPLDRCRPVNFASSWSTISAVKTVQLVASNSMLQWFAKYMGIFQVQNVVLDANLISGIKQKMVLTTIEVLKWKTTKKQNRVEHRFREGFKLDITPYKPEGESYNVHSSNFRLRLTDVAIKLELKNELESFLPSSFNFRKGSTDWYTIEAKVSIEVLIELNVIAYGCDSDSSTLWTQFECRLSSMWNQLSMNFGYFLSGVESIEVRGIDSRITSFKAVKLMKLVKDEDGGSVKEDRKPLKNFGVGRLAKLLEGKNGISRAVNGANNAGLSGTISAYLKERGNDYGARERCAGNDGLPQKESYLSVVRRWTGF